MIYIAKHYITLDESYKRSEDTKSNVVFKSLLSQQKLRSNIGRTSSVICKDAKTRNLLLSTAVFLGAFYIVTTSYDHCVSLAYACLLLTLKGIRCVLVSRYNTIGFKGPNTLVTRTYRFRKKNCLLHDYTTALL